VDLCVQHRPDIVLLDLLIPGVDGIATVQAIHQVFPDLPVIAMLGWWQHALAEAALNAGAVTCLDKGISGDQLAQAVRKAVG
jgi:DNA-binding NarL/FixJ family response regulator